MKPSRLERIQPLTPTLISREYIPSPNLGALTTRVWSIAACVPTRIGTLGLSTMARKTKAITATIKLHAEDAAQAIEHPAYFSGLFVISKLTKNVVASPPKNALENDSCRAISAKYSAGNVCIGKY